MKKSEAKKLVQEGKAQIHNDAPEKLELLRELAGIGHGGHYVYYKKYDWKDTSFPNLQTIKLSEIEEDEVQWQYLDILGEWIDTSFQCRIKPAIDLQPEIDALTAKAKEAGMEVVITFEKL